MYILSKVDSENEKFLLLPKKSVYTVGRLGTDLLLGEDLSVSRVHVRFELPDTNDKPLLIQDLGSTYGTFINDDIIKKKQIQANLSVALRGGDKVRFGVLKNIWEVVSFDVVTCSALKAPLKDVLEQSLKHFKGRILPHWTTQCTHLTMEEASVTVDLLHALLDNKPIVNANYWKNLALKAVDIHVKQCWPQPKDYFPKHSSGLDIKWRPERTNIFVGKTFVFINKRSFEIYSKVVQKAGGACKDLNVGVRKTFLTKKDVIVVGYEPNTQSPETETTQNIADILEAAGLRIIPEREIGLAIVHCTTLKYCNPEYKPKDTQTATTESMSSTVDDYPCSSIVPNTIPGTTQQQESVSKYLELTIPESEDFPPSTNSRENSESSTRIRKTTRAQLCKERETRVKNSIVIDESSDDDVQVIKASSRKRAQLIYQDSSDESSDCNQPAQKKSKVVETKQTVNSLRRSTRNKPVVIDSDEEGFQSDKDVVGQIPESKKAPTNRAATGKSAQKSPQSKKKNCNESVLSHLTRNKAHAIEESEDDEDLFQFNKSSSPEQPTSSRRSMRNRSPLRSTDELSNRQAANSLTEAKKTQPAKGRISVRNFLEKSQKLEAPVTSTVSESQPQEPTRKRLVLKVISEDDDDDDLFNFIDNEPKKPRLDNGNDRDNSDDELFQFKGDDDQEPISHVHSHEDSVASHPSVAAQEKKSKYVELKPRQPSKVNVSGWLSCSGLHGKIKQEISPNTSVDGVHVTEQLPNKLDHSIKNESDGDDKDADSMVERAKWLTSIKDCIQVRMRAMNLSNRSRDQVDESDTANKYSGRKNFKTFSKNKNLHPQQNILQLKRQMLINGELKNF